MCAICTNVAQILSLIFTQRNNQLVWDETSLIMLDMFNNTWGSQKEIVVDHCVDITLQIALSVISVAGIIITPETFEYYWNLLPRCRIWP